MKIPNHIGIIPDGNKRYAKEKKISLSQAYLEGANIALNAVEWARIAGVKHVSFFGTSNENVLGRPNKEMLALKRGIVYFCREILSQDISLHLVGAIEEIAQTPKEKKTFLAFKKRSSARGDFVVHADVNYSGEIGAELKPLFQAIKRYGLERVQKSPEKFISSAGVPPVDLVIRTGGKPRLSGFLPFQTTYAELYFMDNLWGYFDEDMFIESLAWFGKQDRSKGA
jgi:undecaprenyl diphosphate synthase